jgi:hypothetical protein
MTLSQSAISALDLARRPLGYLCAITDVIDELRISGLVTTKDIGDGFIIIRAVHFPVAHHRGWYGRWHRQQTEQAETSP